ncbi:MAG TPA: response regulator [Spirochaetota bacterium]|nr:response regulator [Spirochaetota bacterium]
MNKNSVKSNTKTMSYYSNKAAFVFCGLIILFTLIIAVFHGVSKKISSYKESLFEVRNCADRIDFVLLFILDESKDFTQRLELIPESNRRNSALEFLEKNYFLQGFVSFSSDGNLVESFFKQGIAEPEQEEYDELRMLAKNSNENFVTGFYKNQNGDEHFYIGMPPNDNKGLSFFARYDAKIITNILRASFGYFYIISPTDGIIASNFELDEKKRREFNFTDFVSSDAMKLTTDSIFINDSDGYRSIIRMMKCFVVYEVPRKGFFFFNPISVTAFIFAVLMIVYVFFLRHKFYRHIVVSSYNFLEACSRAYRGVSIRNDSNSIFEYSSLLTFFQKISSKIKEKEEAIEISREENHELFFSMNIAVIEESFDSLFEKNMMSEISNEDFASMLNKISVIRANQKALDLFSAIGFPDFKNSYDAFRLKEGLSLYRKICGSENSYDKVIDFTCANGIRKKAVFHISRHNMNGNMRRFLISAIDITETIRQSEEIKNNQLMWNYIADSVETPLVVLNSLGEIIKLNQCALSFFKISELSESKKLIDDVFQITSKDGKNISNRIRAAMLLGKPVKYSEISYVNINSARIPVSFSVMPYKDMMDKTAGSIVIFSDLSNQAKIKSDIKRYENVEILYDTMGGVINDFNNILASLSVKISMAKMISEDGSSFSESLSDSEILVNKAKDIMMNVFRMLKPLGSGVSCDLGAVLLKTAAIYEGRRQKIIIDKLPEIYVMIDEESTEKIFYDAASFAVDRSLQGKDINVDIEINHEDDGNSAYVDVIFSKIVLTEEEYAAFSEIGIFIGEKYSQIRSLRDYEDSATGYNVRIKAERFSDSFSLRITLPSKSNEAEQVEIETRQDNTDRKAKILVMDDDDILRKTLKRMLEYMGHSVVAVTEGGEAVELYRLAQIDGKPFDLTILDLNVKKGMGGEEAAVEIIKTNSSAKIIASSGYIDRNESDFGRGNFCAFLSKPFMSKKIAAVINKVLTVS